MAMAVAVLAVCQPAANAEEFSSGIPVGGRIGAYTSTKCGGIEDGVDVGKSLCYT
jgi:hypothetical protein